ncbi:2Fe-2S iron-sulfur cluster-binding protein [Rhizobium sp. PDO1-076]|uniref:2Fe-2S iron-sulfur cluster-binding protein n=1 Tax=Rhizobium sp. PDO1-076 TaxID=1125979 RepID=UPI001360B19A|nr:2Fe-2S iron-sulfur cluster-binding protein [Rhizobium sp. PDO1-076]
MTLLLFTAMHLCNLAFALRSIEALDAASRYLLAPWNTHAGSLLLLGAAVVHTCMGLVSIAQRRSLAMSRTDWVQMILGVVTVPLLISHALLAGVLRHIYPQFQPNYSFFLLFYWKFLPVAAVQQILLLVVLWVHGAIGFYHWLVLRPIWTRIGAVLMPALFMIPILALLGFVEGGRDALLRLETAPDWQAKVNNLLLLTETAAARLNAIQNRVILIYGILLLAALAVMAIRILRHRDTQVTITYEGEATIAGRAGLSILEISLLADMPHAHVCGGRGRCGTCLVAAQSEHGVVSPVGDIEARTLARIGARQNERLACQARLLQGAIHVTRLQPVHVDAQVSRFPHRANDQSVNVSGDLP